MPRLKKKDTPSPSVDVATTLTAGRSRRTIKPNRKYLNDSVVLATASKTSSRSSSPDTDASEEDYRQDEEEEEVAPPKMATGRKSVAGAAAAKKAVVTTAPKPRGRPPKALKGITKTEPVKNLRKEVLKKMDLSALNMGKARVVLTPINKDIKRKLDLDISLEKGKSAVKSREPEKRDSKQRIDMDKSKLKPSAKAKELDRASKLAEKEKSRPTALRKKISDVQAAAKEEQSRKVVNPVALKKRMVERSIMDKRGKPSERSSSEGEEDEGSSDGEDDDDVQIVGINREKGQLLAKKAQRKSPLLPKSVGPLARRIVRPPAVASKRKAANSDDDFEEVKTIKKARPGNTSKSMALNSDEDSDDFGRNKSTRSDKNSSSSFNNSTGRLKAGLSASASNKLSSMTKSISLPALDKTKLNARLLGSKQVQTTRGHGITRPMAQSTPKPQGTTIASKKSTSEMNLVDPICSPDRKPSEVDKGKNNSSATIRIVNIGDIIKNKANSTPDVRKSGLNRSTEEESDDSESSDDSYSALPKSSSADKPKTNNQLVATILERKRPINLDHLRANRTGRRGRPPGSMSKTSAEKAASQAKSAASLMAGDEIDFEDMLQTNIVTANKVPKVISPNIGRNRRTSDENTNKISGTRMVSGNRGSAGSGVKTLASSNNNNVYKSNNNGRFGSTSPQKNPPRILNSTMKLGDSRPFAKLVPNSSNKHYSIDLTDPDNNVKLIASPDSPPSSPYKRSPTMAVPRPIVSSTGLRNASNTLNKPVGGAVQRAISSLSSTGSSPKMKKITCYETWYVINIPNSENKPERPSFAMSMIGLGNQAANIQLPSGDWSHKIILTKRKIPPADGDEVFNGEVEDRAIEESEKRNYEPCNIMFRRRTATPGKFNLQYDRAVIFKNDTFSINVDGKNCQLVGAPLKLDGTEDIETLLAVVDFVNLKNTCVELSAN